MEMHYEIGERDNGIIDGEKVENAFFGWKLFTATAILRCEYSTASLRVLSCNYAAIIRPRCEKSIDGARNGIARHYRLKLYATLLLIKYRRVIYSWNTYSRIYFYVPSSSLFVAQSTINFILFIMFL